MRNQAKNTDTKKLPRQPAAATAEALLEAGKAVVDSYVRSGPAVDDGPVDILPFVSIADVLQATTRLRHRDAVARGALAEDSEVPTLTAGAFYRAFPPSGPRTADHRGKGEALANFRRELGRRIIGTEAYRETVAAIDEDVANFTAAEMRQAVRVGLEGEYRRWLDSSVDCVFYGLILHAKDPEVAGWLGEASSKDLDVLEAFHTRILRRFGMRCRPGISVRQFAAVVRSIMAGLSLDARVPGSPTGDRVTMTEDDESVMGEWYLATLAVDAVMMALIEPIPEGES